MKAFPFPALTMEARSETSSSRQKWFLFGINRRGVEELAWAAKKRAPSTDRQTPYCLIDRWSLRSSVNWGLSPEDGGEYPHSLMADGESAAQHKSSSFYTVASATCWFSYERSVVFSHVWPLQVCTSTCWWQSRQCTAQHQWNLHSHLVVRLTRDVS